MLKILIPLLIISTQTFSQISVWWTALPTAPFGPRKNDICFVNSNLGFTASGAREAHITTDGGLNWRIMFNSDSTFFRSVAFANSNLGFLGNLGPDEYGGATITDPTLIYRTTDGGTNWAPIQNISGFIGRGVCGMQALDSLNIFAVGRVRGPAIFMKSSDGGESWVSKDMSELAAGLLDVYFFNKDTGIAAGQSNSVHAQSSGVVLLTTDGGENWQNVYTSSQLGEWSWKISFPSRNTGYISLQRNSGGPTNILKTTNGGNTWFELRLASGNYYAQGIGFANDTLGWVGGNAVQTTYQTNDGGLSWFPADFGVRINRFIFVNELLGFAAGQTVYRYIGQLPSSVEGEKLPSGFDVSQNFPNPISQSTSYYSPYTKIRFTIPEPEGRTEQGLLYVTLTLYDAQGAEVMNIVDEEVQTGENEISLYVHNLPAGVYFYRLQAGNFDKTMKMVIFR